MMPLVLSLWNDEAAFVVSAELILIATITVLALVVGLSEVAYGVNEELEDVGAAFGAVNQTYAYSGARGHKGYVVGSTFGDLPDLCDGQFDIVCTSPAKPEGH
jgi:hypothetical protein